MPASALRTRLRAAHGRIRHPPDDLAVCKHPRIVMSRDNAAFDTKRKRIPYVARAILAHQRGEGLPNLYDPARGY